MQSKRTMRPCQQCGTPFPFSPWMAKKGGGKFCGHACYSLSIGPKNTTADRLWSRIDQSASEDCWEWTGLRDPNGYGRLMMKRPDGKYSPMLAHRLVWILIHGPVADDVVIRHVVCGNPPCCRPDHLTAGSQRENAEDTVRHGRSTRGERSASAKLTDSLVIEIRARYAAGGISQAKLAAEYGVRQMAVSDLVRGVTWRHLLT